MIFAAYKNETGKRGSQRYSEAQIKSTMEASDAIVNHYRMITVLGHDDITPACKQDPRPVFPIVQFQNPLSDERIIETTNL